jgi:hypothetical protein
VQATPHGEQVVQSPGRLLVWQFVERDQGQGLGAESCRVLKTQVVLQLCIFTLAVIPLLAGNLASAAADALRNVN